MSSFSERLCELRTGRSLTQQQLAEAIGMSKSVISMYEKGKRMPSFEAQEQLADFFNVDIDYLIGRSNETTAVFPVSDASPKRRYLMDRIAKADGKKLDKIKKLMELIDDEEANNY